MESECFFETFKRAFLTGTGYAFSLVFTSKLAEFAGVFKSQNEQTYNNCKCNCNETEEEEETDKDSDFVTKEESKPILQENQDKFKNLLNKL